MEQVNCMCRECEVCMTGYRLCLSFWASPRVSLKQKSGRSSFSKLVLCIKMNNNQTAILRYFHADLVGHCWTDVSGAQHLSFSGLHIHWWKGGKCYGSLKKPKNLQSWKSQTSKSGFCTNSTNSKLKSIGIELEANK